LAFGYFFLIDARSGDANTRSANGLSVLCRSQAAAALDLPFNSDIYVSDFNSIYGTIKAGLWQRLPGWSSCTPLPSATVSLWSLGWLTEFQQQHRVFVSVTVSRVACSAHVNQWRLSRQQVMNAGARIVYNLRCSLASVTRESDVQGCCADVQSHTWIRTNIPVSTGSCRRPTQGRI